MAIKLFGLAGGIPHIQPTAMVILSVSAGIPNSEQTAVPSSSTGPLQGDAIRERPALQGSSIRNRPWLR